MKKHIYTCLLALAIIIALFIYYLHHRPVMIIKTENKQIIQHEEKINYIAPPLSSPSKEPKGSFSTQENYKVSPFTENGDATGEVSIDLSNYRHIQKGSNIILETISGQYPITVSDIILNDDGSYSYTLLGDDGTSSLFIYFPETGKSYVNLNTPDMSFASFLNENGVGTYTNIVSLIKGGFRYSPDDYIENNKLLNE